jgi:hypothetical protein
MSPTLLPRHDSITPRLAAASGFGFVKDVRQILSMGHGFPARTLVGCCLCSTLVGVCPVGQTAQTSFLADLACNVWENGIQADDLAVQFLVRIGDYVVFLIGGHHQV